MFLQNVLVKFKLSWRENNAFINNSVKCMVQGAGQMFVMAGEPFFIMIAGIGFNLLYDRASTSLFYYTHPDRQLSSCIFQCVILSSP